MSSTPQQTRLRLPRLPITAYTLLGILLVFALGALALHYVHGEVGGIRGRMAADERRAAHTELVQALGRLFGEADRAADTFAGWEELRQEIIDPSYYLYWRDHRIERSSMLPAYAAGVELYAADGRALAARTVGDLPTMLPAGHGARLLRGPDGRIYLQLFRPVLVAGRQPARLGWLGISFDFMKMLTADREFRYIATRSLRLDLAPGSSMQPSAVIGRLRFQLLPNPEAVRIYRAMGRALYLQAALILLLAVAAYGLSLSMVAVPLRRLARHIDALRGPDHGTVLAEGLEGVMPVAEMEKLRVSLNRYQRELDQAHRDLDRKHQELWIQARMDPLTGIHNRRGFDEQWRHVLSVARGRRLDVCFLLFDCDRFKGINDTYGHEVGDRVIRALAESLQAVLRHGDTLYRIGGDEFAAILLDSDLDQAVKVGWRCVEEVTRRDFASLGIREPVNISIGVAHAAGTAETELAVLPRQADIAMYHAKRAGQDKVVVYSPALPVAAPALAAGQ